MHSFGDSILLVMSLIDSAVSGRLLSNQSVGKDLSELSSNFRKALIDYLNDNSNKQAKDYLVKVVNHQQLIFSGIYKLQ